MENHDTFNISNAFYLENWLIVGSVMLKMFSYFWPIILVSMALLLWERKTNETR
jgi:hypothetical protein